MDGRARGAAAAMAGFGEILGNCGKSSRVLDMVCDIA